MDNIAVDVVLLPPTSAIDKIIGLSNNLSDAPTRLNSKDCLPHISLAMGVLSKSDLERAQVALQEVGSHHKPQSITVQRVSNYVTPDSKHFSDLKIKPTDELIGLYLEIMDIFRPFLSHDDVQINMFVAPPEVAEMSSHWVRHYYDKSGPEDYHPHITLGEGEFDKLDTPLVFQSSALALCHLGTYCTCRKILAKVTLS